MSILDDTEICGCGHRHGNGPCVRKVVRTDYQSLPEPEGVAVDDPFGWPTNWPAPSEMPMVIARCGCLASVPDDHRAETPEEAR